VHREENTVALPSNVQWAWCFGFSPNCTTQYSVRSLGVEQFGVSD
jgi:hypothetical protein